MDSLLRARGGGVSAATDRLQVQIRRVGPHFRTALITGERGLRKEEVARALHAASPAVQRAFVVCDADRIQSVLPRGGDSYGKAAGEGVADLLEDAQSGTIFIRELSQFSLAGQRALLGLLDAVANAGGERIRVIASVSGEAREELAVGAMGAELLERVGSIELAVTPLRERPEEIEGIAMRLLGEATAAMGTTTPGISDAALRELQRRDWPGNERELESLLRMAMLASRGNEIEERHLPAASRALDASLGWGAERESRDGGPALSMKLQDVVEAHVREVLRRCEGNKVKAADVLGISRSTLYRMLDAASADKEVRGDGPEAVPGAGLHGGR